MPRYRCSYISEIMMVIPHFAIIIYTDELTGMAHTFSKLGTPRSSFCSVFLVMIIFKFQLILYFPYKIFSHK